MEPSHEAALSLEAEPSHEAWCQMRDLTHHPDVLGRIHVIAEEIGLTPGIAKALIHLSPDRPASMRELAAALRCDNSYVTAVVDSLERQGIAQRHPHPTDRRIKIVELTEEGAGVAQRVRAALNTPPAAFAALDETETATLLGLLRKLTAATNAG